jgi:hypothetical protein
MNTKAPLAPGGKAVVATMKIGIRTYERRFVDCGKKNCKKCTKMGYREATHGPYWYLCIPREKRWLRIYLGKDLNTAKHILEDGRIDWDSIRRTTRPKPEPQALEIISTIEPQNLTT